MCVLILSALYVLKKKERKKEKVNPYNVFGEQGWRRVKSTTSHQCCLASSTGVNVLCVGFMFVNMRFPRLPITFLPYKKHSIGAQSLLAEMRF